MIILPQVVTMKWSGSNIKYYKSKGYKYTGFRKEFNVNVLDLSPSSHVKIKCICDYCNMEFLKNFNQITFNSKVISENKICCAKCQSKKNREILIEKHGVENVFQKDDVKEKRKNTMLNRYGVTVPCKNDEIKKKVKLTNLKKYGFECVLQNEEIKNKIKKTNLVKYGFENVAHNNLVKEKTIRTNINKYGVSHPMKLEKYKIKALETNMSKYGLKIKLNDPELRKQSVIKTKQILFKNQKAPCSKQQKYLSELLNGEINFPVDNCSLDIAFPDKKIYIEYDGSGHDLAVKYGLSEIEFKQREKNREYFLKNNGWKLIRIISKKDLLPDDLEIIDRIKFCINYLNKEHNWIEIDIDNNKIHGNEINIDINFKKLRKIKK